MDTFSNRRRRQQLIILQPVLGGIGVGSGILSAIIQWLILGEPENESIRFITAHGCSLLLLSLKKSP